MAVAFLDFEQPIAELEAKIEELRHVTSESEVNIQDEIARLQAKSRQLTSSIFANLTPWQITQLARHPHRPYTLDYVNAICSEFNELHGDRMYADDGAIVGGLARIEERSLIIIGHQKGRDTKERVRRNYGMPKPEGYRKALRLMRLAERFGLPLVTLIDTQGAYPGVGAEERGQSEAIARNLFEMSVLRIPIVTVVTGEGGSGGALGIGVCDRLLMLQYSTYSVISPEGCASILWKSQDKKEAAAAARTATQQRRRRASRRHSSAISMSSTPCRAISCARRAPRRSPASAYLPKTPPEARMARARRGRPPSFGPQWLQRRLTELLPDYPGVALCVAFSGGSDSTALLAALAQLPRPPRALRALHIDHRLQPHSRRWSAHCRRVARRLHVPLTVRTANIVRGHGESLEAAA